MKILFPDTLDDLGVTVDRDTRNAGLTTRSFSMQDVAYALLGIERKVGSEGSSDPDSLDYRIAILERLLSPGSTDTVVISNGTTVVNSTGAQAGQIVAMAAGTDVTFDPGFPNTKNVTEGDYAFSPIGRDSSGAIVNVRFIKTPTKVTLIPDFDNITVDWTATPRTQ